MSKNYIVRLYIVLFLCSDEVRNNNTIVNSRTLNEIKEKVTAALLLYGGRKRSEAERSDAPIK